MPTIQIRDITLLERLNRLKPTPTDYYDDVIYELLKRAEAAGKPKLSGFDNLPQLILEEIKKALDGKLVEALKSAILPAVNNLNVEIPVQLSIKVRMRLEPVFDVSPTSSGTDSSSNNNQRNSSNSVNTDSRIARILELDKMEQQVVEYLRQLGGCWEGSPRSLLRALNIEDPRESLVRRLYKHLYVRNGRVCLPEAAPRETDDEVVVE